MTKANLIDSASILRPCTNRKIARVIADDSLIHYGVKGMKWGVRRTKAEPRRARNTLDNNIRVNRSVGAKAKNYSIEDKRTGETFHFSEGTKIQNSQVFAGKNSSRSLKRK